MKMTTPLSMNKPFVASAAEKKPFIPSAAESKLYDWNKYNMKYFLNGALAGGICCSVTHGAMCPIDVVKTRIQLDPVTYNQGLIGGVKQVIAARVLAPLPPVSVLLLSDISSRVGSSSEA